MSLLINDIIEGDIDIKNEPTQLVFNEPKESLLVFRETNPNNEILRLTPDGKIFWCGREVVGDEMFKQAIIDLHRVFCKNMENYESKTS